MRDFLAGLEALRKEDLVRKIPNVAQEVAKSVPEVRGSLGESATPLGDDRKSLGESVGGNVARDIPRRSGTPFVVSCLSIECVEC
jgi:hypothetical protein